MTVREYYEQHAQIENDVVMIDGHDGWTIEGHDKGVTVCSPGTCAAELQYRDESNLDLDSLINAAHNGG